jgi:signal transduction histidine kinase
VVVEGGGTTQADGSGSGTGGGLGLAVVKTLVEAQHGTIAITSGHRGTTATIRLRFVD